VNNAGRRARSSIDAFSEAEFDSVMKSHLKSTFAMIKFSAPTFKTQGCGTILNTGSEAGLGQPFNCADAAAKEGTAGLTRSVARELGADGVRCNLIRPRATPNPQRPTVVTNQDWGHTVGRLGQYKLGSRGDLTIDSAPENVAALAVWLCSDAAASVNGRHFQVAGPEVGVLSDPQLERAAFVHGGWTVDSLDEFAPTSITRGMTNLFDSP
jgi:NAD(P)-dependent dehydrogenase (short-subunit alcohol dehydrogenase family)